MSYTLGIDPAATLHTSTWVLADGAMPIAAGTCDALPDLAPVQRVVIESIHAAALASRTGKASDRGYNTLTGVIFTEGYLHGWLTHAYPALPVHLIPRTAILQAYLGYWPYRKGLKVDHAIHARLLASHPAHLKRHGLLSTVDKRDAYLASIYPARASSA